MPLLIAFIALDLSLNVMFIQLQFLRFVLSSRQLVQSEYIWIIALNLETSFVYKIFKSLSVNVK